VETWPPFGHPQFFEDLLQMIRGDVTMESLEKTLRLHESLFFNPRMAIHGSFEGRTTLNSLLERWANMLIQMLQLDPLKGDMKTLAKYLLNATKGGFMWVQYGSMASTFSQM